MAPESDTDSQPKQLSNLSAPGGVELLPTAGPFEIGRWVGKMVKADGGYIARCKETDAWYIAGRSHWQSQLSFGPVRARVLSAYRRILLHWCVEHLDINPKDKFINNTLRDLLSDRCFSSKLFEEGLSEELYKRFARNQNMNCIPTADRVIRIEGGSYTLETFNPLIDDYRAAIPVPIEEGEEISVDKNDSFLKQLDRCIPDRETQEFLQTTMGAALIGKNHRRFFQITGDSGSGKSVLAKIMQLALGEGLCMTGTKAMFDTKSNHNGQICDLIELNPRFVVFIEAQNIIVNAVILNSMTGSDKLSNRRPNARGWVKGVVQTCPIILGEAAPSTRGLTGGTINRQISIRLQPIADKYQDDQFIHQLDINSPIIKGFLYWLIEGALAFQIAGDRIPSVPSASQEAQEEQLEDQDPLLSWVMEHLREGTWGNDGQRPLVGWTSSEIAVRYKAHRGDVKEMSSHAIGHLLAVHTDKLRRRKIAGTRYWCVVGAEQSPNPELDFGEKSDAD